MHARSFPPIADRTARVLVVGSMPGERSLAAQQYYAHPQNAFWPILGSICGFGLELPYARRVAALRRHGIAVWDVLASCVRIGSLDADIDDESAVANDFGTFLARHPRVRVVLCNGGKAFAAWRRHVAPTLASPLSAAMALSVRQLPSTSPAHAARSRAQKLAIWRAALTEALR
jgi:double-stranded uracil-DNA glycosylase